MHTLLEKLKNYSASDALPMHMPGHKRNINAFPWLTELGAALDITEIDGFDNLNDPTELFRDLESRIARLWGADESICLVNGSTTGVLSAIRAALEHGGELLMCRGCHKSVYHAAELVDAKVHYLVPQIDQNFNIWGSVTAEEVSEALDAYSNVCLVAITSPTYEGVISDIQKIADVCHAHGALLFVDEAHGAHLGFGGFPESAVKCGADLVVQSLHKTLPSLTQTAVLHINRNRIDPTDVRRNTAMFQTSSPFYLLSASIDGCTRYMEQEGVSKAEQWLDALQAFYNNTQDLKNLRILHGGDTIYSHDPSKIVISAAGTDINGPKLMEIFRENFHIELEMAYGDYVLAMTGMGDTKESLQRLSKAVHAVDDMCHKMNNASRKQEFSLPDRNLSVHEALTAPGAFIPLSDCLNKISAEYVWAYPPGTPLLVPGEVINETIFQTLLTETNLHATRGELPKRIFCVGKY